MVLATLDVLFTYLCSQIMKEMLTQFTVALSVLVCGSLSQFPAFISWDLVLASLISCVSHSQCQGVLSVCFFKHIHFPKFEVFILLHY